VVTHESKHALKLYEPYSCQVSFFPCYPSVTFYDKLLSQQSDPISDLGDVTFVGANISDRTEFVNKIRNAGISISVFGHGWSQGRISQQQMLQIFRDSKISLNFTKSGAINGRKQLKARSFEIVLTGGFLLTEHDEELLDYFEIGNEIDTFSSHEECIEKIHFYLNNPDVRQAMQERAVKKCRAVLNFESVWSEYLNMIEHDTSPQFTNAAVADFPKAAIKAFVHWNYSFVLARLLTGQPSLAVDQASFCLRELNFLAQNKSRKVWLVLFFSLVSLPVHHVRSLLAKSSLLRG
jgi:hypothetical protein